MEKEDERDRFEKWFVLSYGKRPAGILIDIDENIKELMQQAQNIRIWEAEHRAALLAWHEKHSRLK